jgi:hypothetical protein
MSIKTFSSRYAIAFIFLLAIEILIAVFSFHPIIRGFIGDVLVVVLLYTFLKIFLKSNKTKIALGVLGFAFFIEILQLFKLVELFEIRSKVLRTVIGSVFDVWDLVAYTIGLVLILIFERYLQKKP